VAANLVVNELAEFQHVFAAFSITFMRDFPGKTFSARGATTG
jgi:hypothetical protein